MRACQSHLRAEEGGSSVSGVDFSLISHPFLLGPRFRSESRNLRLLDRYFTGQQVGTISSCECSFQSKVRFGRNFLVSPYFCGILVLDLEYLDQLRGFAGSGVGTPSGSTMKDTDIKRLFYAHLFCVFSIILTTFTPSLFLEDFSVLETHLTWLCICSVCVTIVNVVLYLLIKPNPSAKRSSISHKISRLLKSCVYFFISCLLYHTIIVLYGAPLIELMLETFLFAVLLSTFTTLPCLCLLGPNIKAWLRVFTKNGATSIWDNSLQITTLSSVVGAWLGAFPIPLDWERPWQVWPISCTLGATFGYVAGLLISPVWIYRNRKQLTYKSR